MLVGGGGGEERRALLRRATLRRAARGRRRPLEGRDPTHPPRRFCADAAEAWAEAAGLSLPDAPGGMVVATRSAAAAAQGGADAAASKHAAAPAAGKENACDARAPLGKASMRPSGTEARVFKSKANLATEPGEANATVRDVKPAAAPPTLPAPAAAPAAVATVVAAAPTPYAVPSASGQGAPQAAHASGMSEAQLAKAIKEGWNVNAIAGQGELEYPSTEELQPFEDDGVATERLVAAPAALENVNGDWMGAADALANVRRVAAHHPALLAEEEDQVEEEDDGECVQAPLVTLLPLVAKLVKNPRSTLSRVACLCSGDLFKSHAGAVLRCEEGSKLLDELLNKAAHAKRFLAEEAAAALKAMAESAAPELALVSSEGKSAAAKAPKVRARAAKCLQTAASRADRPTLLKVLPSLLPTAAKLLVDRDADARAAARATLPMLRAAVAEGAEAKGEAWEAALKQHLSPVAIRDVLKATG